MPLPLDLPSAPYDLAIVGGGINGAGIARDAAQRGLRVLLCEKDDLAAHTSSSSSKLIHGGLRYLEHYEFRLVGEALAEREVLLNIAPHIIWPLEFCMPHVPELRPAWMIRIGLLLYDHLGRRERLPGSRGVDLRGTVYGKALAPTLRRGFVYSDCWVDDARLVVLNVLAAARDGATILTRTACVGGRRETRDGRTLWNLELADGDGVRVTVSARGVVNAAGPWVKQFLATELKEKAKHDIKQVKGSHIVVRRLFPGEHAYILQNDDRRIIFLIPYERDYTLIGTTDVEVQGAPGAARVSPEEIDYLCRAANRYLAAPIAPADVVWSYTGVRPLYDDGTEDPSSVTRDYTLIVDDADGQAPLLSVFGGKITTYRRLAETALAKLARWYPNLPPTRTGLVALPGGDLPGGDFDAFVNGLRGQYPGLDREYLARLARRHGTGCAGILGKARSLSDLGEHFGDSLYAAEVEHFLAREWAESVEDILWRRTKCGLHMSEDEQRRLGRYVAGRRR